VNNRWQKLKRISLLRNYIRETTEANQAFLLGENKAMSFVD
jgi:hypothetical protein